jgi:hypothetical protein
MSLTADQDMPLSLGVGPLYRQYEAAFANEKRRGVNLEAAADDRLHRTKNALAIGREVLTLAVGPSSQLTWIAATRDNHTDDRGPPTSTRDE